MKQRPQKERLRLDERWGLVLRFQLQHGAMKAQRHKEKETTARATLKGRMKGSNRERATVRVNSYPQTWAKRRLRPNKRPLRAANHVTRGVGAPETKVPKREVG